jgi:uridine phosphorylase
MSPAGRQRAAAHAGLVASGDQFIVSAAVSGQITADLQAAGHAPAVEMEGAAIAQVCADYGVPFAAVRTIRPCGRQRPCGLPRLCAGRGQPLCAADRAALGAAG